MLLLASDVAKLSFYSTSKAIEPSYLFNFVQSSEFVQNLSNLVKGALYPAVTDRQVLAQSIPLPPLPEQKRIVGILSDRLTAIDKARIATEAQLKAAKALPAAY
ncbi:MAG: restriction endonuclease subunit S, partial [Leptolyngbyaceae cyanobacterium CAN_BIN12]|nr:restriction endonuclease subunit S [Leptolyngbyaceae cyanobacterium CAN_BIN12]